MILSVFNGSYLYTHIDTPNHDSWIKPFRTYLNHSCFSYVNRSYSYQKIDCRNYFNLIYQIASAIPQALVFYNLTPIQMKKMVCVALVIVAFYHRWLFPISWKVLRRQSTQLININLGEKRRQTDFDKRSVSKQNRVRLSEGPRQCYQAWEYAEVSYAIERESVAR